MHVARWQGPTRFRHIMPMAIWWLPKPFWHIDEFGTFEGMAITLTSHYCQQGQTRKEVLILICE
jgi:hypothetical protein